MGIYAVIVDNKVDNLIIADSKEIAEQVTGQQCEESIVGNTAYIGLSWDGKSFEQPPITEVSE
jgi:hypothetical protein